jgi:hypothetical protein
VERLRNADKRGKHTKQQVNKRGYNKFPEISKDVQVVINREKIAEDSRRDGLKGNITSTAPEAATVVSENKGLWAVERALRISEGTLGMRPVFHF